MLGMLWFIVWVTVGEAFYEDNNWYTAEDEDLSGAFNWERYVRDNFSYNLRILAKAYRAGRDEDDKMTMQRAKSRLRMLKVFKYTGNSYDFEASNGNMLPLTEGAKYCTMGRHTKVDCNHCTCVAGQLYMCTGMICPEQVGRSLRTRINSRFLCTQGHVVKKDDCNLCWCGVNQKWECTNYDCTPLMYDESQNLNGISCDKHDIKFILCGRCECVAHRWLCTQKCETQKYGPEVSKTPDHIKKLKFRRGPCIPGREKTVQCYYCKCGVGRLWNCRRQNNSKCRQYFENGGALRSEPECTVGTRQRLDACNYCWCNYDQKWLCSNQTCDSLFDGYKAAKTSNFIKDNIEKKKRNTFCEPFTFFSPDNNRFCRNCFCLHNGLAICLLNLCKYSKERDCDEKDEFYMGFYPFCAGCKCAVKEWFCSIEAETCQGDVTCPIGTFIHNPNQHCSICLCGGDEEGSSNMCFTEAKCVRHVTSHMKN